jgi:hypothetical protein
MLKKVGFFQKKWGFVKKPPIMLKKVGFFQKK